jgi:hypothetical protein
MLKTGCGGNDTYANSYLINFVSNDVDKIGIATEAVNSEVTLPISHFASMQNFRSVRWPRSDVCLFNQGPLNKEGYLTSTCRFGKCSLNDK